jgi:hypothetical protein
VCKFTDLGIAHEWLLMAIPVLGDGGYAGL